MKKDNTYKEFQEKTSLDLIKLKKSQNYRDHQLLKNTLKHLEDSELSEMVTRNLKELYSSPSFKANLHLELNYLLVLEDFPQFSYLMSKHKSSYLLNDFLIYSIDNNLLPAFNYLINKFKLIDSTSRTLYDCWHYAMSKGNNDIMNFLYYDRNLEPSRFSNKILHSAVEFNSIDWFSILINDNRIIADDFNNILLRKIAVNIHKSHATEMLRTTLKIHDVDPYVCSRFIERYFDRISNIEASNVLINYQIDKQFEKL